MIAIARATREVDQSCSDRFLGLLPTVLACADYAFRQLKDDAREDAVQEIVASAYVAYMRLVELGKEDLAYGSALGRYAVAQFRMGRRVGCRLNVRDVMSPYARRVKGIALERLDQRNRTTGEWQEAVVEDRRTPVPDQVAFRLDFPAWLAGLSARDRRIAETLALGHAPSEVASRFGICRARVSQKRRELNLSWQRFHGGCAAKQPKTTCAA